MTKRKYSFTYDAYGRVTKTTFPSGYIETYGYDADNNLTSKTDRNNQYITYSYDQLNRLTQKTYPDATSVNYTYDFGQPVNAGDGPHRNVPIHVRQHGAAHGHHDEL